MAFQTIRIKNSNVAGKVPTAGQLDTAELVLNLKDQKLYSKNADGQVFQVGGGVNSGGDPPNSGNEIGDLFWDGDVLLVWDGGQWVPVVEAQEVDLGYTAATDGGTVTNTAGNNAELPLADKTNAGLMSPEGFEKLEDITTIISSELEPADKEIGDVWLDMGDCPPTLKVWTDCQNPGVPEWLPVAGGGGGGNLQGAVQIVSNNGTDLYSTLTAVGGNGVDSEGTTVNATYAWTGAKTGAGATILADVEGSYTVTATVEFPDGSKQTDVAGWTIVDSYIPPSNNTAPVIAVVGEGEDGAYEGNSTYVVTNATVVNGANPTVDETRWFLNGVENTTGTIFTIPDSSVGAVITAKQKFVDLRGTQLVSEASNAITIVERPADAITFDPKISDDGTAAGNQVGKTLTAAADNIVGGVSPQEYAFQWYADGSPESGGDQKTKVILPTDVGKVITCEITVAESDGTNPESRSATYGKTPVSGLAVGKGVINPALNNFEGDTLTGSATVTGAVGSANETYVWELDGSEVQRGSSAIYVAAAGEVRFRLEVTDDYTTKIGEWSDPVTVTENTGPKATMHGLRFDSTRGTELSRTGSGTGTISYWKKDSSTAWVWQHEHQTGAAHPDEIGAGYDGYMSDYYFVDGQDLPADTFVGQFDGKTGPLDSSDVFENIGYKESPADTAPNYDQKWSDNLNINPASSNTTANSATSLAFDSNENTYFDTNVGVGGQAIIDLNVTIENVETLEFYGGPSPAGNGTITVTGTGITESLISNMGANKQSITVSDSTVSNLQFTVDNDNAFRMAALYVNGQILIDGPADNSQVWSETASANTAIQASPYNISSSFNGDLSNGMLPVSSANFATLTTVTFDPPIGNGSTDTVELYWISGGPTVGVNPQVNGSDVTVSDNSWYDAGSQVTSIGISQWDGQGTRSVYAFKVNDKVLIDGPPTWNTSQVWSDNVVQQVGDGQYRPASLAFDGDLSTSTATLPITDLYFTFTLTAEEAGPVRVYHWGAGIESEQTYSFILNGDETVVPPNTVGVRDWLELGDAVVGSNTLVMANRGDTESGASWAATEVNGKILVDSGNIGANGFYLPFDPETGIGVDASGQGNHFQDENFAAGNTDEVWSAGATQSNQDSADPTRQSVSNLFDGDTSTLLAANNGNNASNLIQLTTSIPVASKVELYVVLGTPTGPYILAEDGTEIGRFESASPVNNGWVEVTGISEATSFNQITLTRDSLARGSGLALIRVDGELLIDANIQDTVLDTPMKNYAVLETGSNGNLVATATGTNLTYTGEAGTDYYYEADGDGFVHTGGSTFSSTSGVAYNFGQQPFVAAEYDDSQVWSNQSGTLTDKENLFDGNLSTYTSTSSSQPSWTMNFSPALSGPIRLRMGAWRADFDWSTNEDNGTIAIGSSGSWVTLYTATAMTELTVTRGAGSDGSTGGATVSAIEVDGKILVDTDAPIIEARNNLLYQTWEQWARTALGYALDRIATLEKLRLEDAETIANLRTLIDGALSRIASIESDEVNDDAVDNSLITLVGSLSSQITTWTQRIEQAETALSDVANRVTTLEL